MSWQERAECKNAPVNWYVAEQGSRKGEITPEAKRAKRAAYMREYRQREKAKAYKRRYASRPHVRAAAREYNRAVGFRWRRHGITREIAEEMFEHQGRACLGCGELAESVEALQVDHDHSHCEKCARIYGRGSSASCGQSIRGLVCQSCNIRDVLGSGRHGR